MNGGGWCFWVVFGLPALLAMIWARGEAAEDPLRKALRTLVEEIERMRQGGDGHV